MTELLFSYVKITQYFVAIAINPMYNIVDNAES